MRLILLRHGQTLFNELDYTQGWFDSPLTKLGIQQAKIAKEKLKDVHIDYCYSSPSERAVDTADIVLEGRNIKIMREKKLKEMNFGKFEGNPNNLFRAIEKGIPDILVTSCKEFGGEDDQEVTNRELEFIKELESKYTNETILIAGHGCSLKLLLMALGKDTIYDVKPDFSWMGNADSVMLEGNNLNYKVLAYYSIKE